MAFRRFPSAATVKWKLERAAMTAISSPLMDAMEDAELNKAGIAAHPRVSALPNAETPS
jgi:hypothetical protein